jgi:hypothetical protein
MSRLLSLLSLAATFLNPGLAFGQRSGAGFDGVHSSIQDAVSAANRIAPGGWGGRLIVARYPNRFLQLGGDVGAYLHKDSLEFTVATNKGNLKSRAQMYDLSAWLGLRTPPRHFDSTATASGSFGLVAGYSVDLGAQVRHGSCVNCPERNIVVGGGPFIEPSFTIFLRQVAWGLHVRRYLSGDRKTHLALRLMIVQ